MKTSFLNKRSITTKKTVMLYNFNKIVFVIAIALSLSSCYTSQQLDYLQSKQNSLIIPNHPKEQYTIRPSDVLNIQVQSRDPEQTTFFNKSLGNGINQANAASFYSTGYSVDPEGKINLAIVGELNVADLTIEEIRTLVQKKIDEYLLNATVTVQLMSFKVSVLGDVKNPGTNYIYNSQATIFEGLAAAGDLNITAKRNSVKLIRQVGDASVVVNLDLTEPSILKSPYYFLHPNDVIYVDTSKPNIGQRNLGSNLGVFSLVLSAITTAVLVLNFTQN